MLSLCREGRRTHAHFSRGNAIAPRSCTTALYTATNLHHSVLNGDWNNIWTNFQDPNMKWLEGIPDWQVEIWTHTLGIRRSLVSETANSIPYIKEIYMIMVFSSCVVLEINNCNKRFKYGSFPKYVRISVFQHTQIFGVLF